MKELSKLIKREINKPSPIREIMKMAEPKNIINLGLNPDEVISFGGGWVNHASPEELRKSYADIINDIKSFHNSGGYSPTLGFDETRESIVKFSKILFNENINKENIIVGGSSTQLTIDLLRILLDPNDTIILPDPTYANYYGQISFISESIKIKNVPFLDSEWKFLSNKKEILKDIQELMLNKKTKAMLIASPDNPTSQIIPHDFMVDLLKISQDTGTYLIIDYAYKTQYFEDNYPAYFSYTPLNFENLITINSNSKWGRGLGRRLGWLEGNEEIISAMERAQQVSILCPDTLHQMAFNNFMKSGVNLRAYVDNVRKDYKKAGEITIKAINEYIGYRYLIPQGGLYVPMEVGEDSNDFVINVLKNTGVIFVPGKGFGKSMEKGVRISYGPLVNDLDKIITGISKVGKYVHGK
ncbi:MAG: pyridoxal phosphate-dependent aminotransferase [Thermoplasmata archaeon]